MPDLRKRKATGATGPPRTKEARLNSINEISGRGTSSTDKPTVGDLINLDDIGGEIETNDGVKVTLKLLVDRSKNGVVLFTYPKASTPGCMFLVERWTKRKPQNPNDVQAQHRLVCSGMTTCS